MRYLFVGGPFHGEFRIVDNSLRTVMLPTVDRAPVAHYLDHGPAMCLKQECCGPTYRTVEYTRMDIGTDYVVYVARRNGRY
jgi:hypothetical protein